MWCKKFIRVADHRYVHKSTLRATSTWLQMQTGSIQSSLGLASEGDVAAQQLVSYNSQHIIKMEKDWNMKLIWKGVCSKQFWVQSLLATWTDWHGWGTWLVSNFRMYFFQKLCRWKRKNAKSVPPQKTSHHSWNQPWINQLASNSMYATKF